MLKIVKNMLILWRNNVSFHNIVYSLLMLQSASKQNGLLNIVAIKLQIKLDNSYQWKENEWEPILHVSTNRFHQLEEQKIIDFY